MTSAVCVRCLGRMWRHTYFSFHGGQYPVEIIELSADKNVVVSQSEVAQMSLKTVTSSCKRIKWKHATLHKVLQSFLDFAKSLTSHIA